MNGVIKTYILDYQYWCYSSLYTDGTKFNWTVALGENAAIDQLDMVWERRELEDELSVKTNGKTVKGTSQQWAANKNVRRVMKRIFPEVVERAIYSLKMSIWDKNTCEADLL